MSKNVIIAGSIVILAAIFFFMWRKVPQEAMKDKPPVKIGVDVFPGWAHVFIAQEKGIFQANGVDVEIVFNRDYLAVQNDFAIGATDGAFMVYVDAIFANDQALPLKVVYISDQSVSGDVIVAKPEFTSIESLRGQKLGIEGVNTFSHLFVLSVLEKHGLKEGDVFFENINAQEIPDLLEKGQIAAGHTYGPAKNKAKEKGYVFLAQAGEVQGIITDVLAFNPKMVMGRSKDIQAIVKSLFQAKEFQMKYRKESLEIMARALGDTMESVGAGIDAVEYFDIKENFEAMQSSGNVMNLYGSGRLIADFFIQRGQISEIPDLGDIIEDSFVEELLNEK